jgi:hypothetical protein
MGNALYVKNYNYRTRALNASDDTITEGTEVLQGIEDVTKAILQFYGRTKIRHDFCMDSTASSFPLEFQAI